MRSGEKKLESDHFGWYRQLLTIDFFGHWLKMAPAGLGDVAKAVLGDRQRQVRLS